MMFWRQIRENDLSHAIALEPRNQGAEIVGADTALRVWRGFFANRAFRGIVVESNGTNGDAAVIAAGTGVMVRADFMNAEVANPQPHLNSRIIASVAAGASVLLPWRNVGLANAGDGIDIVNLMASFRSDLTPDAVAELSGILAESFLEMHKGFRLNRILREMIGHRELQMTDSSGIFRTLARFPANESAIKLVTRTDAFSVPHSIAINMFRYEAPRLRLRDADQQLLIAALDGHTDAELSELLGVSLPAIKKRWLTIYQRVAGTSPKIVAQSPDNGTRGRQKRHHVLAYIRSHPEELRPFG
jgi:hypothetical protein